MGLKDINMIEQHVEKIVLGVAAAGAVVMGWLSLQTVTIPNLPVAVGPKNVEEAISNELQALDRKKDELERQGAPQPKITNWVGLYREAAGDQPLDPRIVSARWESFAPPNLTPRQVARPQQDAVASIIPDPALPEALHAEALQLAVSPAAPQVAGGQPVAVMAPQVRNVVAIDGFAPVGKMVLQMANQKNAQQRFTADVQRGIVYRVRVQRQELQPNSGWSKWEDVAPSKGSPAPDELLSTAMKEGELPGKMTEIDAQFPLIQMPTFYWDAQGQPVPPPILARPIPAAISAEMAQLHNDIQKAQQGALAGGFTPIGAAPPAAAGGAAGAMLPAVGQCNTLEVQPFTFWDETVKPDHSYRYRVQLQEVNPGFTWKWGLAKPEMKLEPVIPLKDEGFVEVSGVIYVRSDMAFFITGTDSMDKSVEVRRIEGTIFKQENGRWFQTSFTVEKGMDIGSSSMSIGSGKLIDVDTKFALVDAQRGTDGNVHVILRDPSGNLVTRDSADDSKRPEKEELIAQVRKGAAAATAAASEPAVGSTPPPATRPNTASRPVNPGRGTNPPAASRGAPVPVRPGN